MDNSSSNLVICSVMVAPARRLFFYKIRTWLDQVVKVIVHTFAVDQSKIPLNPGSPDGYWYCAGDFCNVDEAGLYQHLSRCDLELAKCLVAPNIKDNHPEREILVISGEYGVHYVCHNIANRVLFATDDCSTLIDLDIKTTGYELVVKSALGVYGQNKVEWENRKKSCNTSDYERGTIDDRGKLRPKKNRTRYEEIDRIHLRASGGNVEKARNLTDALLDIDERFYSQTEKLIDDFDAGELNQERYHFDMINACGRLFSDTINTVGYEMTRRIYPDCNIEIEGEDSARIIRKQFQAL